MVRENRDPTEEDVKAVVAVFTSPNEVVHVRYKGARPVYLSASRDGEFVLRISTLATLAGEPPFRQPPYPSLWESCLVSVRSVRRSCAGVWWPAPTCAKGVGTSF